MRVLLVLSMGFLVSSAAHAQTAQPPSAAAPASSQPVPTPSVPAPPPALPAEGYDIVKTIDGAVLVGRILRETATGYLFRTSDGQTSIVEFSRIADLQSTKTEDARATRQPPETPKASPAAAPISPARLTAIDQEMQRLNASYRSQLNAGLGLGGGLMFIGIGAVGLACCVDNNPSVGTTSIVAIVSGGVLALVGGIMLGVNASHNSGVDAEIRKLESERRMLDPERDARGEPPLTVSLFAYSSSF